MKKFFPVAAIVFLTLAVYSNSYTVPIQFDDIPVIQENILVHHLSRWKELFGFDPSRFLTHVSFAVNYHFDRLNVFGFHLVNLFLHCANGVLLFYFLRLTVDRFERKKGAGQKGSSGMPLFASLIFALHPVQTESVTYIVQRSVLWASFFYLSALILYIRLRKNFSGRWYTVFWLVILLGTMTKPIFVTVPLAAALYDRYFLAPFPRRKMMRFVVPGIAVMILIPIFLVIFFLKFSGQAGGFPFAFATRATVDISRMEYFLTQLEVLVRYLGILCWPAQQTIYYFLVPVQGPGTLTTFFSSAVLVGLLAYALAIRNREALASFGILWFFILMIPESSIFPLPHLMFEHRLYLAVGCLGVVVTRGVEYFVLDRRRRIFYLSMLIFGLGLSTYARNIVWNDPPALWEEAIRKFEDASWGGKSGDPNQTGRESAALREVQKRYLTAINHLGIWYLKQKDFQSGEQQFRKALAVSVTDYDSNFNLGDVLARRGNWQEAIRQYQKVIRLWSDEDRPYARVGEIYRRLQQNDQAEKFYQLALERNPLSLEALFALGNLYLDEKKYAQAIVLYQKLLARYPYFAQGYNTLGIAYSHVGRPDEAQRHFRKALELDAHDATVYFNLAELYRTLGRTNEAEYYDGLGQKLQTPQRSTRGRVY